MSLKGKTLFITGAIARHRPGHRSAGGPGRRQRRHRRQDRRAAQALPGTIYTAAEEIETAGGKALPLVVDVRDEADVKAAVEQTVALSAASTSWSTTPAPSPDRHARRPT